MANALVQTAKDNKRDINADALALAVKSIGGFPYMLQLVGFYAWDLRPESRVLEMTDFQQGIAIAQQEMTYRVLDSTLQELSPSDIKFAVAMLDDEKASSIADITKRLGWSTSQISQYRNRLIAAGVIGQRSRGIVEFALPYFREYLQERLEEGDLSI